MLKKLLVALLIGLCVTLYIAQDDSWVRETIGHYLKKTFEDELDCSIHFNLHELNFFSPRMVLKEIRVYPRGEKGWAWQCDQSEIAFSWFNLLGYGTVDMHVVMDSLQAESTIKNGGICLWDEHMQKVMTMPYMFFPTFLKTLAINGATFTLKDDSGIQATFVWNSKSKKIKEIFKSHMQIIDGSVSVQNKQVLTKLAGDVQFDAASRPYHIEAESRIECTGVLPHGKDGETRCFIDGSWYHDGGKLRVTSADTSLTIDPVTIQTVNDRLVCNGTICMPCSYLLRVLDAAGIASSVQGNIKCTIHSDSGPTSQSVQGVMQMGAVKVGDVVVCDEARVTFKRHKNMWRGDIFVTNTMSASMSGTWSWSEDTCSGSFSLANRDQAIVPGFSAWAIAPQKCCITMDVSPHALSGSYTCKAQHTALGSQADVVGTLAVDTERFETEGTWNKHSYALRCVLQPTIRLKELVCKDSKGNDLVVVHAGKKDSSKLHGTIAFPFIRTLLRQTVGYDVQGEGIFHLDGRMQPKKLTMKLWLEDGTIRLPHTYNFMDDFHLELAIDSVQKKLVVQNMLCALHKGNLRCQRAVAFFDDTFKCTFAYVPLLFESCLVNLERDLFTIVSGNVTLNKTHAQPFSLNGRLILERTQLKENLFSDTFVLH